MAPEHRIMRWKEVAQRLFAILSILLVACLAEWMTQTEGHAEEAISFPDGDFKLWPVIQSGQVLPGSKGGVITTVGVPRLNNSGHLALVPGFQGGGCSRGKICRGLYVYKDESLTPLALTGQEVPGTSGGHLTGGIGVPAMNGHNTVAFLGEYSGGNCPPTSPCRAVLVSSGAAISIVAKEFDPIPGTNGGSFTSEFDSPSLNERDEIAFGGSYREGDCPEAGHCPEIYVFSRGAVNPKAVSKEKIMSMKSGRFSAASHPSINDIGTLAIMATYTEGMCPAREALCFGIFIVGKNASLIANQGDEALGMRGSKYVGGKGSFGFGWPSLNNRGMVAYTAELSEEGCSVQELCEGVFLFNGAEAQVIAYSGQPTPGVRGGVFMAFSRAVALSDSASLAFEATYQGGECPVNRRCSGVFLSTGSGLIPVALKGQMAPGTEGGIFDQLGDPSVNSQGVVAFSAKVRDQKSGTVKSVVFLGSPVSTPR
jgi:hypothetical protein